MNSFLKWPVTLLLAGALAACGGGGGSAPFGGSTGGSSGGGTGTGGGTTTPPVVASDLIIEVSKSTLANAGSDTVTVTATALDGSRNTLTGATIGLSVDSEAVLTVTSSGTTTTSDGKRLATLTTGANRSNRTLTVTATSGSLTRTATVQVIGARLTGTLLAPVVDPGAAGRVTFRLVDQATTAMVGQAIRITATGLNPAEVTATTNTSGEYVYNFTAPSTAGIYTISATAGGATLDAPLSLQVQNVSTIPAVTTAITSASVSANPSVVGTNSAGATTNRSEIRALFLGASNRSIPNVRVKLDLAGDANTIGGSFSTGTSTLYSDANGVVTSAYIPGSRASPTNGVTVRACYYTSDAEAAADPYANGVVTTCARSARVTLTVTSDPLGVSIGTNELIIVNELTYVKKMIVSVVDSAGRAKADVPLVVSLDLPRYRKGNYQIGNGTWNQNLQAVCFNEDTNRNGVLETGEDIDGDGRLEPGKSDVSVTLLQSSTRTDGTAELQIQYAKSFATWVDARITVAASGVSGTEGRASLEFTPVAAEASAFTTTTASPAFQLSPYGLSSSCSDPN